MSIRKVSFVSGEYYHIYNRGNSKQKIFNDKEDYERFVGLLYACNQRDNLRVDDFKKDQGLFNIFRTGVIIGIGAYCLMPNHFHILVTEIDEDGISRFIQKFTTAYVMYYNKKYKRTGSLFEGKFKAQHLDRDIYLKYLFSYIHLNPIKLIQSDWKEKGIKDKDKIIKFLTNYKYSSFLDYLDVERVQNKILDKNLFPKYFPDKKSFTTEILDWINYK